MKDTKKKKSPKRKRAKKAAAPHVYQMPATAAQLGILCCHEIAPGQPCLKRVAYYDPEISGDPREACLCESCPRSSRAVKLLVIDERAESGAKVA